LTYFQKNYILNNDKIVLFNFNKEGEDGKERSRQKLAAVKNRYSGL